jgi:hypothetical protein
MLDADRAVHERVWSKTAWRMLTLDGGRLTEAAPTGDRA